MNDPMQQTAGLLDAGTWAAVPFHFWSAIFFVLGTMIGSFLNVCIYRLPREESIVSPPSHCPHCNYSIPWYLNMPIITWLYLRGKCANCHAPISPRYLVVELLTGLVFLATWLSFGAAHPGAAVAYCVLLAGFITATFIDFEHFIIPDEITLGGTVVGFLLSALVPSLHHVASAKAAVESSLLGIAIGAGVVYLIVRGGKLIFGKRKVNLPEATTLQFTEDAIKFPDEALPYEDIFYRKSDCVTLQALKATMQLHDSPQPDGAGQVTPSDVSDASAPSDKTADAGEVSPGARVFENVSIRLFQDRLLVGEESFEPERVKLLEVTTEQITLPQEAMGLGDVKFMAAIGAFMGWKAVLFSLFFSSVIGATVGIAMIAIGRRHWSSRIPYGPYIALAAVVWVFAGNAVLRMMLARG